MGSIGCTRGAGQGSGCLATALPARLFSRPPRAFRNSIVEARATLAQDELDANRRKAASGATCDRLAAPPEDGKPYEAHPALLQELLQG